MTSMIMIITINSIIIITRLCWSPSRPTARLKHHDDLEDYDDDDLGDDYVDFDDDHDDIDAANVHLDNYHDCHG